jgi:hypothetical protein
LEVYTRPYDPRFPQVCLDETHTQLLGEVREPLPCAPGLTARHDPEYARRGRQPLPRLRAVARLAACDRHRAAHGYRLGALRAGDGR